MLENTDYLHNKWYLNRIFLNNNKKQLRSDYEMTVLNMMCASACVWVCVCVERHKLKLVL